MTLTKERFKENCRKDGYYFALEVKDYTQEIEDRGNYSLEVISIPEGDLEKYDIDDRLGDINTQPPVVRLK